MSCGCGIETGGGNSTSPVWVKVTKTFSDFSAAATTNSINIYGLGAGWVLHAVKIKQSTAFSGGAIASYTVSVGVSGNNAKYASAFDVFQAVAATTLQVTGTVGCESQGAIVQLTATATSTGANLNAAAAGSVDIWLLVSNPG